MLKLLKFTYDWLVGLWHILKKMSFFKLLRSLYKATNECKYFLQKQNLERILL